MKNKEAILRDLTQDQAEQVTGGAAGEINDLYEARLTEDTKGAQLPQ